jgi:cyclopropane fatty-acyl-phospholipid synthase-like methyltransferase
LHFSGAYDPVVSVGMQAAFGFPASTNLSHGETFVSEQRKKMQPGKRLVLWNANLRSPEQPDLPVLKVS